MTEEGKTVLIAEDEVDNREILRAIVEDLLGYRAVLAENGEEALQAIAKERPSLVLMDLMMPVMDGFEAISKIKQNKQTSTLPVVAVTALIRPTDRQRALECGADDFVGKPFEVERLIEVIRRLIS